jgi:hypothetical protein
MLAMHHCSEDDCCLGSLVQYSTVQCSAVQCSAVQCTTVRYMWCRTYSQPLLSASNLKPRVMRVLIGPDTVACTVFTVKYACTLVVTAALAPTTTCSHATLPGSLCVCR